MNVNTAKNVHTEEVADARKEASSAQVGAIYIM